MRRDVCRCLRQLRRFLRRDLKFGATGDRRKVDMDGKQDVGKAG
jgi:hypothetical protein